MDPNLRAIVTRGWKNHGDPQSSRPLADMIDSFPVLYKKQLTKKSPSASKDSILSQANCPSQGMSREQIHPIHEFNEI